MHRWTRYRYITRLEWCACKRVKRRDIFYIYEYLPLLCSRAAGLWQRANRELTSLSLSPSLICSFHLSPAPRSFSAPIFVPLIVLCSDPRYYSYRSFLVRSTVGIYASFSLSLSLPPTLWSAIQDTQPAARPCVISHAIPYSVPTMICSRLVPR